MDNYKKIEDGFEIILSKEFYERETIFNVAYKYNNKFLIMISPEGDKEVKFVIRRKEGEQEPLIHDIEKIFAEFIDEQLKLDILKRTQDIRDRIYEKAFLPLRGIK